MSSSQRVEQQANRARTRDAFGLEELVKELDLDISDPKTKRLLERLHSQTERAKEAEEQAEKERKERRAAEERAKEAEEQAEKERKKTLVQQALREGTFYATFDEVWKPHPVSFIHDDYKAMIRAKVPVYEGLDLIVKTPFLETLMKARNSRSVAASAKGSERSSHTKTETRNRIWQGEVLESEVDKRNDPGELRLPNCTPSTESIRAQSSATACDPNESAESDQMQERAGDVTSNESRSPSSQEKSSPTIPIAHLVPAASGFASLYHHVAIWVFGLKERAHEPIFVQKLIHGSKPSEPHPEPAKRSTGTGLKHMICNKIRLSGQDPFFDVHPCLLIVPVLSLQQAKNWNGEGYHAIFMISTGNKEKGKGFTLQRVASTVQLQYEGAIARKPDIEVAGDLLATTIKALAYALIERSGENEDWVCELSDPSKKLLNCVRGEFSVVDGNKLIKVPKLRQENDKNVRKITFAPAFGPSGKNGHPAPDPLLLAVKSALNWSKYHEQKLMAAGEDDESDSDVSERSLAAMEEYLAMQEHYEHARRDKEIMNMTIRIS